MIEDHPLSPPVEHVCGSFALIDGKPQLVRRAFRHAMDQMRKTPFKRFGKIVLQGTLPSRV